MSGKIICGDSLEMLKTLESESVDCVITSPPYFGLRDYGHEGQIGLEDTPEKYVESLVAVFREAKRVLKNDGTLWLNLGDSYNSHSTGQGKVGGIEGKRKNQLDNTANTHRQITGVKDKDLIGIPWRVAFALQADGWYLRQDIIWAKPNPMPESVTDRCTKSHEYIFLLSKSPKYYFDNEAIKEKSTTFEDRPSGVERNREYNYDSKENNNPEAYLKTHIKFGGNKYGDSKDPKHATKSGNEYTDNGTRNRRSVWTVTTKPFKEAHFATFPEKLVEPMILAGCPKEVCKKCGKARFPIMKSEYQKKEVVWHPEKYGADDEVGARRGRMQPTGLVKNTSKNVGWTDCGCNAGFTGGIVLDPFSGAATTGVVAKKFGRNYIGIELNPDYVAMSEKRLAGITPPLF